MWATGSSTASQRMQPPEQVPPPPSGGSLSQRCPHSTSVQKPISFRSHFMDISWALINLHGHSLTFSNWPSGSFQYLGQGHYKKIEIHRLLDWLINGHSSFLWIQIPKFVPQIQSLLPPRWYILYVGCIHWQACKRCLADEKLTTVAVCAFGTRGTTFSAAKPQLSNFVYTTTEVN